MTVSDPDLLGHEAELSIHLRVEVLDSRPVNSEREIFRTSFRLDSATQEIPLPPEALRCYSYEGSQIRMEVVARLKVDDSLFFDSKAEERQDLALGDKPRLREDPKELIEPKDAFDFIANFEAIPVKNRGIVSILMAIAAVVILVNSFIGFHDQMSPERETYFYSHRDSDGDSQSPFFNSLLGSGTAGALLWVAIRRQLRTYMKFQMSSPPHLRRDTVVPAGELLRGVARVPLEDIEVRVVAANRERGQYKRGSGTKERTVSFSTPVRAVVLYRQHLRRLPAGAPIQTYLEGEVSFEPMFAALYPPLMAGSHHGVDVVWEAQLLHPLFVDQELQGKTDGLVYEDFLEA